MTVFSGRSPVQVAEDALLFAATQHYNVNRFTAVLSSTPRREIAPLTRKSAEKLLAEWTGTVEQCREAKLLSVYKQHAIARGY